MLLTLIKKKIYFCHDLEIKLYVNHTVNDLYEQDQVWIIVIIVIGAWYCLNCMYFVCTICLSVCLSDVYDAVKGNFPLGSLSLKKEYENTLL